LKSMATNRRSNFHRCSPKTPCSWGVDSRGRNY
jgi:hypothetical protein